MKLRFLFLMTCFSGLCFSPAQAEDRADLLLYTRVVPSNEARLQAALGLAQQSKAYSDKEIQGLVRCAGWALNDPFFRLIGGPAPSIAQTQNICVNTVVDMIRTPRHMLPEREALVKEIAGARPHRAEIETALDQCMRNPAEAATLKAQCARALNILRPIHPDVGDKVRQFMQNCADFLTPNHSPWFETELPAQKGTTFMPAPIILPSHDQSNFRYVHPNPL